MDLLPSPEQNEIAGVAAAFLRAEMPINAIRERRALPASFDAAGWQRVGQLGWFGLGLPESLGGIGYGAAEEAILFRELGRHLASGPFVGSVIGARLAALAGDGDGDGDPTLTTAILLGDAAVCVADSREAHQSTTDQIAGDYDLIDAAGSRYALVSTQGTLALVDLQPGVYPVDAVDARDAVCIDPGVRLATATLDGPTVVAQVSGSVAADLRVRGSLLVSAMLCGIAEATRDMSAEYAKVREQFGRPIGVNQAIKHACADMAVRAESATSQLFFAAAALDGARADVVFQCASAAVIAADAAMENSTANIQVHGGMGYTFEHDAHLFLKRTRVLERMFGPPSRHLSALLAAPAAL